MNKYRFVNTEKQHLHQLWSESDEEFKNLTGTSSVVDILGKNLTWWAAEMTAVSCLENGEKILTIREEYLMAVNSGDKKKAIDALQIKYPAFKKARFAHFEDKNEKADEGTELHERLELAVKMMMDGVKVISSPEPKVMEFVKWAEANVKTFLWSEMNCYSSFHFIGGISDAGAEMKDGSIALIDFKSAKEAYFSHFVQCALYSLQISENKAGYDKDGNQVFALEKPISQFVVFPFGGKKLEPIVNTNIEGLKRAAISAINLYREKGIFEK